MSEDLIIESRQAKRRLRFPFAVCGSPETLRRYARALEAAAGAQEAGGVVFGWVSVDGRHPSTSPPNCEPLEFDEPLPHRPAVGTLR